MASKAKVKSIIRCWRLEAWPRSTASPALQLILYADEVEEAQVEEEVPDYPCTCSSPRRGTLRRSPPVPADERGAEAKKGDEITQQLEEQNTAELLFFSDRSQVYKLKAADFADTKASVLGEYIPARAQMDEGSAVYMAVTHQYEGFMLFFFENGKVAKVEMSAYQTKQNRKKLLNAYSDKSPFSSSAVCEGGL